MLISILFFMVFILAMIFPIVIWVLQYSKYSKWQSIGLIRLILINLFGTYVLFLLSVWLRDVQLWQKYQLLQQIAPNSPELAIAQEMVTHDTGRRLAPFTLAIWTPIYVLAWFIFCAICQKIIQFFNQLKYKNE